MEITRLLAANEVSDPLFPSFLLLQRERRSPHNPWEVSLALYKSPLSPLRIAKILKPVRHRLEPKADISNVTGDIANIPSIEGEDAERMKEVLLAGYKVLPSARNKGDCHENSNGGGCNAADG